MIRFEQNKVYRPIIKSSKLVCNFLEYIHQQGFYKAPKYCGSNDEKYILSYVEGETYNLDHPVVSEGMLISSAKLLREYHDVSEKFIKSNPVQKNGWMFEAGSPIQVICHNDFAPYNICYKDGKAIGMIDFETAAPGPRIWDIAYASYRFVPFMASTKHEDFGTVDEQIARARLFCNAYNLKQDEREGFADIIINRLKALLDFMKKFAEEGYLKYIEAIEDGHHYKYLNDIEYIEFNKHIIDNNLIKELK